MLVDICIDWGNTLVKVGLVQNNIINKVYTLSHEEAISGISDIIDNEKPHSGILSCVADIEPGTIRDIKDKLNMLVELDSNTPLPIMNAYMTPDTLGADRIALAAGAMSKFPGTNVLVISVGTCITYNFLQANKTFRGGSISPGLHMRFSSLKEHTDRLPLVTPKGELLLIGYNTDTSIRSGVMFGITAEIEGMVDYFHRQYPEFNAVLTGGDAGIFANKLKNKIFADPDILIRGLNTILQHNVPKVR